MEAVKSNCCKTKTTSHKKPGGAGGSMSLLSTMLLILLPKCPLCFAAYLSAMALFFDVENEQLVPILIHAKPLLGVIIIALILFNQRGRRTWIALGLAITAMVFLVVQTYFDTALLPDWIIYTAFFFSIWYNGNFKYFYLFVRFGRQQPQVVRSTVPPDEGSRP